MSNTIRFSIGAVVLVSGLAACAGDDAHAAKNDDFNRDLQMASTTLDLAARKVDPANLGTLETQPSSAPKPTTTVKKASSGNRAVLSQTPTVHAAPTTEVAASDESEQTQTVAEAPAPQTTEEPVAQAPQPSVIVVDPQGGEGDGEYGTSGNGGGIFGPGHGGIGVVIRGGGIGDDDHCEIIPAGRTGTARRPVFVPNPGGMGAGRFPSRPATRPTIPQTSTRPTTIGTAGRRRGR